MHGLIHVIFKSFIVTDFGEDTWQQVLAKCGLEDDTPIMQMQQYPDDLTLAAVGAACAVLNVDVDTALGLFGRFFVRYLAANGWTRMLLSLGSTLEDLLVNLNGLHSNLERDFRTAIFPQFHVTHLDCGGLELHYTSARCFPALVEGVLLQLAKMVFQCKTELRETERKKNSVKWFVKDLGPLDKEDVEEAVSEERAIEAHPWMFSFQLFHAAMSSAFTCQCDTEKLARGEMDFGVVKESAVKPLDPNAKLRDRSQSPAPDGLSICMTLAKKLDREYDFLAGPRAALDKLSTEQRLDLARQIFRGITADQVATTWPEVDTFTVESKAFWDANQRLFEYFDWSQCRYTAQGVVARQAPLRFASHSWSVPERWAELMGDSCIYADVKATELCIIAKDLSLDFFGDHEQWQRVEFWIDKCCIGQESPELVELSVLLIEEFLQLSDGLVVLLNWTYLTRLWCVYEWACFLAYHDPSDIIVCAEPFYRKATEPLFLDAVRNFKVENCQCFDPRDRSVLIGKVAEYYRSTKDFEEFLQFTVIACMARCLTGWASRSPTAIEAWARMAEELEFDDLAGELWMVDPSVWRNQIIEQKGEDGGNASFDMQAAMLEQRDEWFNARIAPMVRLKRDASMFSTVRHGLNVRKTTVGLGDSSLSEC
mmetsp:Transcript_9142/g.19683  ORF Transcript_9142/g.19683 Transcript_9142/m.19683 type:complete len:653 (-) Transcript_9142:355-2313(-)